MNARSDCEVLVKGAWASESRMRRPSRAHTRGERRQMRRILWGYSTEIEPEGWERGPRMRAMIIKVALPDGRVFCVVWRHVSLGSDRGGSMVQVSLWWRYEYKMF